MNDTTQAPGADDVRLAVDAEHPWLGLASFSEETRGYFYGREEEVAELCRRVQRKQLTILFGQSGLGKTSILRAGIVPRLRPEGYCPVYVRIDYSPESPVPTEQIKQAIFRATQAAGAWTQPGTAVSGESLWEFLHHRDDVLRDASGKTLIPLLIFDQFEELFTLAQSDDFGRQRAAQFIEDLSDLVENRAPKALEAKMDQDESAVEGFDFTRSDYRILIALREDYLAHLEGLKGSMPSISQNRMRLARMTGAQALSAVVKPGGRLVSEEVAGSIVRFVAGGAELVNAEVEPALLSLICRELNNARIAQGRSEISADLLAGSRDNILSEFYERALADQPAGVRQFVEDNLLTESGHRESLAEERVQKGLAAAGAPPDALATLVNRRLLRIEERLDVRRVELTHDVLTGVVKGSRDLRLEREARDAAERDLAAQRAREIATRKALVRARKIASACAVLAIVAGASAVYGYFATRRAEQAEAKAQHVRQMAEASRGEAEKLIVYLLDDFYLELEPVGRLDIVGELAKRALDYYGALPPELRTAETDRNRALAQVRYGAVLRNQSKLDESQKALSDAVAVLGKLKQEGDKSEPTAIGLAIGLMSEARVANSLGKQAESLQLSTQAVDVLKPLLGAAPSIPLRRAYGAAMLYLGFAQQNNDQPEQAVATLEEARATYRGIDGLRLADLPSAAAFAEASSWQVSALQQLGRNDDARRVGAEASGVAGQVLEKRPGHMAAMRSRALIANSLGDSEMDSLHIRNAIAQFDASERDWEAIVKIDPTNQIAWNNLGNVRIQSAWGMWRMGRIRESVRRWNAALAVEKQATPSPMISSMLSIPAASLAALQADAGNREAALAALSEYKRLTETTIRPFPADSFMRSAIGEFGVFGQGIGANFGLPVAAADYATVRAMAQASIQRAEAFKPGNPLQELIRNRGLGATYAILADALYNLKEYAAADKAIKRTIELRHLVPTRTLQDKRDASDELILAAMIAARLGHSAEATQIIDPILKFHRGLYASGNEDLSQHLELARALYASALVTPGKSAQLAEAAAIIDRMPLEMRHLTSTSLIRDSIAEEQKARSK
jgi:tetratricopeptide (TPR) repeat protein